jgi:hypothetical protein
MLGLRRFVNSGNLPQITRARRNGHAATLEAVDPNMRRLVYPQPRADQLFGAALTALAFRGRLVNDLAPGKRLARAAGTLVYCLAWV